MLKRQVFFKVLCKKSTFLFSFLFLIPKIIRFKRKIKSEKIRNKSTNKKIRHLRFGLFLFGANERTCSKQLLLRSVNSEAHLLQQKNRAIVPSVTSRLPWRLHGLKPCAVLFNKKSAKSSQHLWCE